MKQTGIKKPMIQKSAIVAAALLSLPFFLDFSSASELIGSKPPYFRVRSGDDRELTLDTIKGKVVLISYESKDIVENNTRLKVELNKLYYDQTEAVKATLLRLPIINCSDAAWPFVGAWKRKLGEHSIKEGVTIYCDWNGKMASDYKMRPGESNILIIDKSGRVKFFTSGEVKAKEIHNVKELLKTLAAE